MLGRAVSFCGCIRRMLIAAGYCFECSAMQRPTITRVGNGIGSRLASLSMSVYSICWLGLSIPEITMQGVYGPTPASRSCRLKRQ